MSPMGSPGEGELAHIRSVQRALPHLPSLPPNEPAPWEVLQLASFEMEISF